MLRRILGVLLCCLWTFYSQASHIKAGDIQAERTSSVSLTYTFTLNLYTRPEAVSGIPVTQATMDFGDNKSTTVNRAYKITYDSDTEKHVFIFTHTYSGPGFYRAGYKESNRIGAIINMSNSFNTPFYVETGLSIDPFLGLNSSPILSVPPLDKGAIGEIFTHNPGAYDPDGDSLAFSFYIPQQSKGVFVFDYKDPDQYGGTSTTGGAPFITINPISGDIVWNAPSDATNSGSLPRYYNIAIRVDEFRAGVRIGYVIRDMQIEIDETQNKPPILKLPSDTCIVAGTLLKDTVTVTQPFNHNIFLESYSGVYSLVSSPATYLPVQNNNTPAPVAYFNWQTTCDHIREQPYDVVFRAKDISTVSPQLADVRSFLVYVKAPKPKNLLASASANAITLTWDPYKTSVCANASKIRIYRKECTASAFVPEPCDDGILPDYGYTFIKEVDAGVTTYTDNNNGAGLTPGVGYCYTIVATFASPANGTSYPSDETCSNIAVDVPVIGAVSVTSTGSSTGTILLTWYAPLDNVTGPFSYEIFRASSDAPSNYVSIATVASDTFYVDNNLATDTKQYFYKVKVVGASFAPLQSSVALTGTPASNAAVLSWNVNLSSNLDTIEVWSSINGAPYTLSKVLVNPAEIGSYTDNTVHNCDTVLYYLKVKSRYCDPRMAEEHVSLSPVKEVIPLDDTPPPAPALVLKSCAAPYNLTQNELLWNELRSATCNTIKGYNVYYASHEGDALSLLAFVQDTFYVHPMVDSSLAGCYVVKALNYQDIEGAPSARLCVDNCVYYQLPNLVTRNNDGKNDIFKAFPIPKGVQIVRFNVYNRWGNRVYGFEGDPNINWRTIDGSNVLLSEGVYYYEAEVHYYRRLNPDDETQTLKGWVHLIGDKEPPNK